MASIRSETSSASQSPIRLVVGPGTTLLALLAAIDEAPASSVVLDGSELPRALQTRTCLVVMRRRASRRGKRLHLVAASPSLRRIARAAELDGIAAPSLDSNADPFARRGPRLPPDAFPAIVVLDQPVGTAVKVESPFSEIANGVGMMIEDGNRELDASRVLPFLARRELEMAPIPAFGSASRASSAVPAQELSTVVGMVAHSVPHHRVGHDGPETIGGTSRGNEKPALRVVRTEDWGRADARSGSGDNGSQSSAPSSVGRQGFRTTLHDPSAPVRRERVGVVSRRISRERLNRLAGRDSGNASLTDTHDRPRGQATVGNGVRTVVQARVGQLSETLRSGTFVPTARRTVSLVLTTIWSVIRRVRIARWVRQSGAVLTGLSLIVGLFGWYILPSATVEVRPTTREFSATVPLVVDPGVRKADEATGRLPGRLVIKEASETVQVSTTGKKTIAEGRAGGDVVFTNGGDRSVAVPKGMIVSGGGQRFMVSADIVVAPTIGAGPQRRVGMAKVPVQAVEAGTAGNVERLRISVIDGPLAGQILVQNDVALRGGTERAVTFVSSDDRRRAVEQATKAATDKLIPQTKTITVDPQKETVVPLVATGATPTSGGFMVVESNLTRAENDEASSLSATVKVRYAVTVFETAGIQSLASVAYGAIVGRQQTGFVPTLTSIRMSVPEIVSSDTTTGQVQLRVRVDSSISPTVDVGAVRAGLVGKDPVEARAFLAAMPGVASSTLTQSPNWSWWRASLPAFGFRIAVTPVSVGM